MDSRMQTDLVMKALLTALWHRVPKREVTIHSDQGTQCTSSEWLSFLKSHGLVPSMSRRGNCFDNAAAESFFPLLKRERIKRRIYPTRETAKRDIFNYIEMFYNPSRRHETAERMSPVQFEKSYYLKQQTV